MRSREQQLVDILFQVAMMTQSNTKEGDFLRALDRDKYADWIRHNLKECGFPVTPIGISWGVLDNG